MFSLLFYIFFIADLRRQMADIRNRDRRHNSNTAQQNKSSHTYANRKANVSDTNNHNHNASSEDSESDSSSSSSSSSSNSSNSDSESDSSVSSRSRSPPSRTVSSKSSLMSGVSDNNQDADESSQLLFKHDCDSIDEPIDSNATPVDKITLSWAWAIYHVFIITTCIHIIIYTHFRKSPFSFWLDFQTKTITHLYKCIHTTHTHLHTYVPYMHTRARGIWSSILDLEERRPYSPRISYLFRPIRIQIDKSILCLRQRMLICYMYIIIGIWKQN